MVSFTKSVLQQQYPLSPRKFWKKIIEKIFVFIYLPVILLVPAALFVFGASIKINGHVFSVYERVWLLVFCWLIIFLDTKKPDQHVRADPVGANDYALFGGLSFFS